MDDCWADSTGGRFATSRQVTNYLEVGYGKVTIVSCERELERIPEKSGLNTVVWEGYPPLIPYCSVLCSKPLTVHDGGKIRGKVLRANIHSEITDFLACSVQDSSRQVRLPLDHLRRRTRSSL